MKTSLPTATDLSAFLQAQGLLGADGTTIPGIDLETKVDDAVEGWNTRTGYFPFLQTDAVTQVTRYYDPPGPEPKPGSYWTVYGGQWRLILDNGLISVSALTNASSPYTIGGTTNVQAWAGPYNAPADKQPYRWIQWQAAVFGQRSGLAVTGVWGYGLSIPTDAWQGILFLAAADCTELVGLVTGGMVNWTGADISQNWGKSVPDLLDRWRMEANKRVIRYAREPLV